MPSLSKHYTSAFVLDKAKLTRLVQILSSDFTASAMTFEVTFSSGRKLNLTSVDEVVALDNALSDPITELAIKRTGTDAVSVNFDSDDVINIDFRVRVDDNQAANQLYGEVADQIDRIRVRSVMALMASPMGRLVVSVCLIVGLIVGLFSLFAPTSSSDDEQATLQSLLRRARVAQSDHDKLQIVFEKSLREIEAAVLRDHKPGARHVDLRMLFVILPLLIVICSFMYLLWRAYPWAVFKWGDGEHRYHASVDRRKFVWSVIVIALIVGIVSNLFVISLPSFA